MPASMRALTVAIAGGGLAAIACLAIRFGVLPVASGEIAGMSSDAANDAAMVAADKAAMESMMSAMAVKPSGDADYDFASAMIPHHEAAIAMAVAELKFGKNEQLRRIAQEIIVDQQQEIDAMRRAIGCSGAQTTVSMPAMQMNP
jgi:hypothetical protein